MSEHKMVTECEAVQREREAFVKGTAFELHAWQQMMGTGADSIAEARYPMPKVTRPRVVSEDTPYGFAYWRFVEGELQWARSEGKWHTLTEDENGRMFIRAARVRLLAHLMDNPTEEVDADADV